ncbi:hypothetical protein FM107_10950 [Sphingobacterium sp. JB170]|nr:hypothetical protein FM107_10950 [Sphingobacterium sp. JB170]
MKRKNVLAILDTAFKKLWRKNYRKGTNLFPLAKRTYQIVGHLTSKKL